MQLDATFIAKVFGEAGVAYSIEQAPALGDCVRISAADAAAALRALKTSTHAYTFLVDLFGIDTGAGVDVVYHLRSFVYDHEIHIKAGLDYGADLGSVWEIYPAALMAERECAEMFGLTLSCHPNPKRLLTTEAVPPLLLKSTAIRTPEEVRNR